MSSFHLVPYPLLPKPVVSLSQSSCVSPIELTDRREGRGRGEEGAKSYYREKAGPL
jgi:hypothetical protein